MISLANKLLVMEGYDAAGMASLRQAGATPAGRLYKTMLSRFVDPEQIDIAEISVGDSFEVDLNQYAGVCWTGSNLFFSLTDHIVERHVEWCQRFFDRGIPQIGSCWGAQLAAVAGGGTCERNPNGREFGIGQEITLTQAGKDHPMFRGKGDVFAAFESHVDSVTKLPENATLLAGNAKSPVQALEVRRAAGVFWAFQYHPEYDFAEIAALAGVRREALIEENIFTEEDHSQFVDDMKNLQRDPKQPDLHSKWAAGDGVLDPKLRVLEIENWLNHFFA